MRGEMNRLRATAIAAVLLPAGGCGTVTDEVYRMLGIEPAAADTDAFDTDWEERVEVSVDVPAQTALDVGTELADPTAVAELVRAEKILPLPGLGATTMGFRVDQLASVFALAGALEVPEWSAPSEGSTRFLRDDDLDTAWTCVPDEETRCAIGMHFPSVAVVHSVRLFGAALEFDTYPRIKRVRVHTEQGFTDALLTDHNAPVFVEFAQPVTTRTLVVEVLEVFPGEGNVPKIHISELEAFGVSGVAREPLDIDPRTTIAVPAGTVWRSSGRASFDRNEMFLYRVDPDGTMHRFIGGTALRGHRGDRLMLIERLGGQSDCDAPRGTFFLLDTKTRVTAPLGDLDGVGGVTFRASDGQGIAIGYAGKLDTKLNGIFFDDDEYRRRQTPFRADLRTEDYFEEWGLDPGVVRREPPPLNETIEGCTVGTDALLAQLEAAKEAAPKRTKRKRRRRDDEPPRASSWQVCALAGGARAFLTDNGPCGASWEVTVLDGDDAVVASEEGSSERSFLRVAHLGTPGDAPLLVQIGDGTDTTSIVRIAPDGIEEVSPTGSFAIQPPSVCRENCLEPFPNPGAPVWQ